MTFNTKKLDARRFAFTLVELVLDKNDPALDDTFALQADSYGTPKTTDNINAFTGVDFRTFRYSDQQLFGVDHFIGLKSATTNPPRIDPGKTIGFRASGTITLIDFNDNDAFSLPPPYDDRRVTGSHFKKLFARNHLKNRRAKIIRGYDPFDYSESNAQVENYIIDSYTQPNMRGEVTINVVDELILIESSKAKAPEVSLGELTVTLNESATNLTFSTSVTDEYGAVSATGHIAIEKEIIAYTVTSSTTMDITRKQFGTTNIQHEVGENMQKCIIFDNENIIDIITTLITDFTKIPTSYIPVSDWAALKAGDLANYNLTKQIYKPEDVKKLLNELVALAGLSMYVDVIEKELVIVTTPDFATPVITFDETEHIIQDSIRVKRVDKEQITRQAVHWDKKDSTDTDREESFTKHFQVIDIIVEVDADESNVSENKPLITSWLINTLDNNLLATSYSQRNVNRFSKVPIEAKFDVDQRYINTVTGGNMWLGSIFNLITNEIVDGGLNPIPTTFQCVSIKPSAKDQAWKVTGLSYVAAAPPDADLYISEDKTDYLLTDELTTTEAKEYVVVINSGVLIDSSGPTVKSFIQGTFFAGATLKLIILGRIVGYAGTGGFAGSTTGTPGSCSLVDSGDGTDGGDALSLSTDTTIDNGFGLIAAGGGGAAGSTGICLFETPNWIGTDGLQGGGGQGQLGADLSGTIAAPGPAGGAFGEDGTTRAGGAGGLAGVAIQKNGNTVIITSGNNSEQIKGAII